MLVHRTTPADIAATLRIEAPELRQRVRRMLVQLQVPVPGHGSLEALEGVGHGGAKRVKPSAR
jgi:hypothetical protein